MFIFHPFLLLSVKSLHEIKDLKEDDKIFLFIMFMFCSSSIN